LLQALRLAKQDQL